MNNPVLELELRMLKAKLSHWYTITVIFKNKTNCRKIEVLVG